MAELQNLSERVTKVNDEVMEMSMSTREKFAHLTRLTAVMLECKSAPLDELIEQLERFKVNLESEIDYQKKCYAVLKNGQDLLAEMAE